MAVSKVKVPISISLPYGLVCQIDEKVKEKDLSSRSSYIVELVKKDLEQRKRGL